MFCIFPSLAGLYVYKKIDKKLHPYIYSVWLAIPTEVIARWAVTNNNNTIYFLNYDCFMLINFFLFMWLFHNYKLIGIKTALLFLLISVAIRCFEFFKIRWDSLLYYSSIYECLIIISYCIKVLTNIVLFSNNKLLKSTLFIILISTIFLNLFDILNTILGWIFPISKSATASSSNIFIVVNTSCYLTITYAFLCTLMTKK